MSDRREPWSAVKRLGTWIALGAVLAGCAGPAQNTGAVEELQKEKTTLEEQVRSLTEQVQNLEASRTGKEQAPKPDTLVNPNYEPAVGGTEGWQYHQTAAGDLDGDGAQETIHVTTNAEWIPTDRTWAWDDGHPWHVYVEEADGTRTYLFSQWVQLGLLEVGITHGDPEILILNRGGNGVNAYRLRYRGPGQVVAAESFRAAVLRWAWFADANPPGP